MARSAIRRDEQPRTDELPESEAKGQQLSNKTSMIGWLILLAIGLAFVYVTATAGDKHGNSDQANEAETDAPPAATSSESKAPYLAIGIGGVVVGVAIIIAGLRWANRKFAETAVENEKPGTTEVTEDGIQLRTSDWDIQYSWRRFRRTEESERLFLLLDSHQRHVVIPKEAFEAKDIQSIRSILKAHFPTAAGDAE